MKLIEQPPLLYRMLFPKSIWRIPHKTKKVIYLTFDDGPIPEITPWVLAILEKHNIKATFFCVGDNVRKYPEVYKQVLDAGHRVGNHTFNHIQGIKTWTHNFQANTKKASEFIDSDLFRPPHGHMRFPQYYTLKSQYKLIMWDVVTRDYSKYMTAEKVLNVVKQYVRNGSIIVFHDSLKAEKNMKGALEDSIIWLKDQGYTFEVIP